jgi:hypothetical protein
MTVSYVENGAAKALTVTNGTFTMPAADVDINCTFTFTGNNNNNNNNNTGGGGGTAIIVKKPPVPLTDVISFTAFIQGFEDNTFRGNDLMTREQFVTILSRLSNPSGVPQADKENPSFSDVSANRWSYNAVEWAKAAGITEAGGNANFRPDAPLTRAEMAGMLVRALKLTEIAENTFSDLKGDATAEDILKAVKANIFTGYPDGTFRPEGSTTRYEAVAALIRYLFGGEPKDEVWKGITLKLTDVTESHWAYRYVALAVTGYSSVRR